jgi:hypothetical protein
MYIHIELKRDVEADEALHIARQIINILDVADKIPPQITEISIGGEYDVWVSDEAEAIAAQA